MVFPFFLLLLFSIFSVFDESKIILLIKLACVVIVRHYEFGAKPETVYPILKETMGLLDYFAQEPSGFLSAFGLSRKQIYTSRYNWYYLLNKFIFVIIFSSDLNLSATSHWALFLSKLLTTSQFDLILIFLCCTRECP